MKKILILHTGGTIAMSEDKNGAVAPGKFFAIPEKKIPSINLRTLLVLIMNS